MTKTDLRSLLDLRKVTRRALAIGHSALEQPTRAGVREAKRLLHGVLRLIHAPTAGELAELAESVRGLLAALVELERNPSLA
jgi:hypothetical protein